MNILGIIPARGGSMTIPRKNIAPLCGKPLIAHTCEAAQKSASLTRTIISTDDNEIAEVARRCGIEVPFMRPQEYARDETPMFEVIEHAVQTLQKKENYRAEIIVLLQPTSPLRTAVHIDAVVSLLLKSDADSAVTVVEVPHQFTPTSLLSVNDGYVVPYQSGKAPSRRQDKPKLYARNGPSIIALRVETLLEKKSLYGVRILPFIMKPEESLDIDTLFDLKLARCLLSYES